MDEKTARNVRESPKVLRQDVATLNAESFCKILRLLCRWIICGNRALENRGE